MANKKEEKDAENLISGYNYFVRHTEPKFGLTPVVFETTTHGQERAYDIFSMMMKNRIIVFDEQVVPETANILKGQLLYLDSVTHNNKKHDDITLYLDCPGGAIYSGLGIYDVMQYIESDIITICIGLAASFGAVLLAAGTKGKRYALPHSTIMIHEPLGGVQGRASDIKVEAREITRLEEIIADILSYHTGQPRERIMKDTKVDFFMDPDQAVEYGLIDNVLELRKIKKGDAQ